MFKKYALISVTKKDGILPFVKTLIDKGWLILSSGGTAKYITDNGIEVTDVAEITGMQAVLGHRVVTLAPQIHGGLLASTEMEDELSALGWLWIDLLYVDMYPLDTVVFDPNSTPSQLIEKTDIGGPAMIRSAVKGGRIVVTDEKSREWVMSDLVAGREPNRDRLALQAELHVAKYCGLSALAREHIITKNNIPAAA